jgi:hypothetical protein
LIKVKCRSCMNPNFTTVFHIPSSSVGNHSHRQIFSDLTLSFAFDGIREHKVEIQQMEPVSQPLLNLGYLI